MMLMNYYQIKSQLQLSEINLSEKKYYAVVWDLKNKAGKLVKKLVIEMLAKKLQH